MLPFRGPLPIYLFCSMPLMLGIAAYIRIMTPDFPGQGLIAGLLVIATAVTGLAAFMLAFFV
jgi:hypothetical protein